MSAPITIGLKCSTSVKGKRSGHVGVVESVLSITLLVMLEVNEAEA